MKRKYCEVSIHGGCSADQTRWKYLGGIPNNQSIVQSQQSNAMAALIEKVTNGIDAIFLRYCRAKGIDPRGPLAPKSMAEAVETFVGDLSVKDKQELRRIAEDSLVLYATGMKARPSISLYEFRGEGATGPCISIDILFTDFWQQQRIV